MALSKDFATGTKYYYVKVCQFQWVKDNTVSFTAEKRVRDNADAEVDYVEAAAPYEVEVGANGQGLPDSNDRWSTTNLDTVNKNFIGECYEWLKSDTEEYATGWTDV